MYGLITYIRNRWYDRHPERSQSVPVHTIGVGNLAVGGTGKTPHVLWLVKHLREQGKTVAVLSRGYKRLTKGYVEATADTRWEDIGDELMLIHNRYPDMVVVACEDRVAGVNELHRRHPEVDCVVLDDVFQHRAIRCDEMWLLTTCQRPYSEDHVLPWGRLREYASGARRANHILVTRCPERGSAKCTPEGLMHARRASAEWRQRLNILPEQTLSFSHIVYREPQPVFPNSALCTRPSLSTLHLALCTGIAQADELLRHLREQGLEVEHLRFGDHHAFTERDMECLVRICEQHNDSVILTTEKDAVRLRHLSCFPDSLKPRTFYIPIDSEIEW